jgi:hypothetical protein
MARAGQRQQNRGPGQANAGCQRRQRAAEHQRRAQDRPAQPPADKDRAPGGGQHRTDAEREVEVAGPRLGATEHADGQDDDQQVQRTHHDRVRGQ